MLSVRRAAGLAAAIVTRTVHTLPKLPYGYDALSPVISADIMRIHYEKHHAAYVNNLNQAETKLKEALAAGDVNAAAALEPVFRFNGGGHINHSIFWQNLSPSGGGVAKGEIGQVIVENFRSFDRFKELLTNVALGVQGSGWAWLGYNPATGRLRLIPCANQDPLQATTGMVPLLGIDVWEHAYYLQYKNVRADYVKEIWNVINWADVESRLQAARMAN